MRTVVTRTSLGSPRYPHMQTVWTEDQDFLGWTGSAKIWPSSDECNPDWHEISLRQTTPLGGISAMVDPISHGCWASTNFEGTVLTERDLQWAAAWASAEIKRKREALGL